MAPVDTQSDDLFLRFGLLGTGVLCWMASRRLWHLADVGALPLSVVLMIATCLVGFGLLLCACGGKVPRAARYLLPVALVLIVAHCLQIHEANARLRGGDVTTDVLIFEEYAAHVLLEGQNPFRADLLEAYRAHRTPFTFSTPSVDGSLTGRQPYPALSFLIFVPLLVTNVDVFIAYPLFQIAAFVVLFAWASPRYRPVILLPFLAEPSYMGDALGGVSDPVWAFLVLCMVVVWKRPTARGVLYGLAVAFKQHAWYLAPFLLVRIAWETEGSRAERARAVGRFVAVSGGVFLAVNLPFIVWDPESWLLGVFAPVLAPMHVYGQGASALTTVGWVTVPKSTYSLVTYGLLAVGLVAYARHAPRVPYLMWVVPGIALWFGHRSLTSYWYYLALPLAADLFGAGIAKLHKTEFKRRSFVPELALAGALVAAFVLSAVRAVVGPPGLTIELAGPHEAVRAHVVGTSVRVRNETKRRLEPRFQVHENNLQPFFWAIDSGPKFLRPGQSAVYEIGTRWPPAYVEIRRGGRVIVHPADAHEPRVAVRIEGDLSAVRPSVAPNGRWRLWNIRGNKPHFWDLSSTADDGRVRYTGDGSRGSLAFVLPPAPGEDFESIVLDTTILVPDHPFQIDVRPPRGANRFPDPDIVFGLQFRHGANEVSVLFGEEPGVGRFDAHRHYKVLPAPPEEWSTHSIDVRGLFAEFGLRFSVGRTELPRFPGLDFPMSPLGFDLTLRARRTDDPVTGEFGELVWSGGAPDPREIYRQAARHPEHLVLWKADFESEMGNEEAAAEAWRDLAIHHARRGHCEEALDAVQQGRAHDPDLLVELPDCETSGGLGP
jgi:uncharacterized membrane protein